MTHYCFYGDPHASLLGVGQGRELHAMVGVRDKTPLWKTECTNAEGDKEIERPIVPQILRESQGCLAGK
jgi:hypothetical protein